MWYNIGTLALNLIPILIMVIGCALFSWALVRGEHKRNKCRHCGTRLVAESPSYKICLRCHKRCVVCGHSGRAHLEGVCNECSFTTDDCRHEFTPSYQEEYQMAITKLGEDYFA